MRALAFKLFQILEALRDFFELDHFALSQVVQVLDLVFQLGKLFQELQVLLDLPQNAFGVFEDSCAVDHLLNRLLHVDDLALWEFVRSPMLLDEGHEPSKFGRKSELLHFVGKVEILIVHIDGLDTAFELFDWSWGFLCDLCQIDRTGNHEFLPGVDTW